MNIPQYWESDYWDEFVKEFGINAYVEERYINAVGVPVHNVYDSVESWAASVDSLAGKEVEEHLERARNDYREALDKLADL